MARKKTEDERDDDAALPGVDEQDQEPRQPKHYSFAENCVRLGKVLKASILLKRKDGFSQSHSARKLLGLHPSSWSNALRTVEQQEGYGPLFEISAYRTERTGVMTARGWELAMAGRIFEQCIEVVKADDIEPHQREELMRYTLYRLEAELAEARAFRKKVVDARAEGVPLPREVNPAIPTPGRTFDWLLRDYIPKEDEPEQELQNPTDDPVPDPPPIDETDPMFEEKPEGRRRR